MPNKTSQVARYSLRLLVVLHVSNLETALAGNAGSDIVTPEVARDAALAFHEFDSASTGPATTDMLFPQMLKTGAEL